MLRLDEPTLVYLIYRSLLEKDCDVETRWEEPYPKAKQNRVDLAFVNNGEIVGAVEAKWLSRFDKIAEDVAKMKNLWRQTPDIGKFVLVFCNCQTPHEMEEDLRVFQNGLDLQRREGWYKEFPTMRLQSPGQWESSLAGVALLEVG